MATVIALIGLGAKAYRGPAQLFVNHYGPASVAYEIVFMLLTFAVWPSPRFIYRIAVVVCVATSIIEILQLFHPPWLVAIRSTFLGRCVLGNSFSWMDFPAYVIGCAIGVYILRSIDVRRYEFD